MNEYPEHGDFRVGRDGQIVLLQSFGSWNREGSLACTRLLREAVLSLEGRPFGVCIDTYDFEGIVEDGYENWYEALDFWKERNLTALVRIDDVESFHYKAFLEFFDKIYSEATRFTSVGTYGEAFAFFHSLGLKGFESGVAGVETHGLPHSGQGYVQR